MNGILIVDKPAGWTSNDAVAKLRGVLHERRIGHGGTLDPMATGVLPVFVGRATRAAEFCEGFEKEYFAGIRLGLVTDTQDITGTVINSAEKIEVSRAELSRALAGFRGSMMQTPPMYSAVKVGGRKLYELARRGVEIERSARPITVSLLEIADNPDERDDFLLHVVCTKGTYVRTLIHDIGQTLGCGAAMSSLRRTRAGDFSEIDAIRLEELIKAAAAGDAVKFLLPTDTLFKKHPEFTVSAENEKKCRNGAPFNATVRDGNYRVYGIDGEFLMLGKCSDGLMITVKSFF